MVLVFIFVGGAAAAVVFPALGGAAFASGFAGFAGKFARAFSSSVTTAVRLAA
jgi:hypothetical protein